MVGFTTALQATCAIAMALLVQMPPPAQAMSLRRLETMKYEAVMSGPSLSCYIENGFDYVGNDIGNAPGFAGECCYKCASVSNCKAWSWSNYNGGTCWFKSAQGEIVVNPAVKSARLFYGYISLCTLDQDTDLVGNDIGNKPSAAAEGCCAICQNTLGCRAYSWTNNAGGTCWLKSKAAQRIYKLGVKSAQAYPMGYLTCPMPVQGVDYVNNDVGNKPSATPEGCCALCKGFPSCRAYSWTNHNGGTCWFKSAKRVVAAKAGVWSAQIYPNAAPSCNVENDVDYVGNDISNVLGTVDSCCYQCEIVANCQAWTWSDHNNGTCWLKSAKGTTVAKAGVKSAQRKYPSTV